jgi:hypothetical protein
LIHLKAAAPSGTHQSRRPASLRFVDVVHALLPAAALCLGFLAMKRAPLSAIGPYGLIQALPPLYYAALGLACISFLLTWSTSRPSLLRLSLDLVTLVVLLQSPPAIIEPVARFATAWLHAGFTDYVAQTGHVLPNLDARFSWPGFFAGMGMVERAIGLPSTIILLKWWPVAINLLYLPPFYLLARAILGTPRRAALAIWLFPLANWVGQDYYSPQSIAFLLYLIFIWLVVEQFGAQRAGLLPWRRQPRGRRLRPRPGDPEQTEQIERTERPQAVMPPVLGLAVLGLLGLAMIVSHQITPIFAGLALALLSFFGRTRLKTFGVLILLLTAGWICYAANAFWAGHSSLLFGGLGNIGANVTDDLSSRLRGSPQHYQVLDVRLLLSCFVWGLAGLGFLVGYRRRLDVRTAAVLMITPFCVLSGGGYGGEAGLRVYLFSLAGALPLIAMLVPAGRFLRSAVASGLVMALMIPAFVLARWGNEVSEMTRPDEITAVRVLNRIAPPGATLVSITPQVSWRFADINKYLYKPDNLDEFAFVKVGLIVKLVDDNPQGGYVLITTSQIVYGEQAYGLPDNWGTRVEQAMTSSSRFVLVYSNPNAKVYKFRLAP